MVKRGKIIHLIPVIHSAQLSELRFNLCFESQAQAINDYCRPHVLLVLIGMYSELMFIHFSIYTLKN